MSCCGRAVRRGSRPEGQSMFLHFQRIRSVLWEHSGSTRPEASVSGERRRMMTINDYCHSCHVTQCTMSRVGRCVCGWGRSGRSNTRTASPGYASGGTRAPLWGIIASCQKSPTSARPLSRGNSVFPNTLHPAYSPRAQLALTHRQRYATSNP